VNTRPYVCLGLESWSSFFRKPGNRYTWRSSLKETRFQLCAQMACTRVTLLRIAIATDALFPKSADPFCLTRALEMLSFDNCVVDERAGLYAFFCRSQDKYCQTTDRVILLNVSSLEFSGVCSCCDQGKLVARLNASLMDILHGNFCHCFCKLGNVYFPMLRL
jgi:hypothetical protein